MKSLFSFLLIMQLCCTKGFCQEAITKNYLVKKGFVKPFHKILVIPEYYLRNYPVLGIDTSNYRDKIFNVEIMIPSALMKEFEYIRLREFNEQIVFIGRKAKKIYRKGYLYFFQLHKKSDVDKYRLLHKFVHKFDNSKGNILFFISSAYNCTFIVANNELFIQPNWNPKLIMPAQRAVDCYWDKLIEPN